MSGILNSMNPGSPPGMGPGGMGMGGPSGKWINQRTGETVIVKDTFIDGEHMNVMLSNGQMIQMNEFSRDYIQVSDETYDANGQVTGSAPIEDTKPAIDENLLFKGMGEAPKETPVAQQPLLDPSFVEAYSDPQANSAPVIKTNQMVDKILDKVYKPTIKVSIEWPECPAKELIMLKNFFDVTDDDIITSIVNKYADIESIKEAMSTTVQSILEKQS